MPSERERGSGGVAGNDRGSGGPRGPGAISSRSLASKQKAMEVVSESTAYTFFSELVDSLYARPDAEGFRNPVFELWTEDAVPGYREIIDTPMDLGTIKKSLRDGLYNTYRGNHWELNEDGLERDIALTFQNCMLYNEEGSSLYEDAKSLLQLAEERFKERRAARNREAAEKDRLKRERRAAQDRERRARQKKEREEQEAIRREKDAIAKEKKRIKDKERREKQRAEKLKKEEEDRLRREKQLELRMREEAERKAREERERKRRAEEAEAAAARAAMLPNGKRALDGDVQEGVPRPKKQRRDADDRSTTSISSGEAAELEENMDLVGEEVARDLVITFVSTKGLEKKRGRKSAVAQQLEAQHEDLMRKRRLILDHKAEFEKKKLQPMTDVEKDALVGRCSTMDFVQMAEICRILATGMDDAGLLQENEIDVDVEMIPNHLLRDMEMFLNDPVRYQLKADLAETEKKLADIEAEYIGLRYQASTR